MKEKEKENYNYLNISSYDSFFVLLRKILIVIMEIEFIDSYGSRTWTETHLEFLINGDNHTFVLTEYDNGDTTWEIEDGEDIELTQEMTNEMFMLMQAD